MSGDNFVTYHNQSINTRFQYPISWTYAESESNPRVKFSSPDRKVTFEIHHHAYEITASLDDPSKYANDSLQEFRRANQFQLLDSGPLSIGTDLTPHYGGYKIEYSYVPPNSQPLRVRSIWVVNYGASVILILQFIANANDFPNYDQTFLKMIGSFDVPM
jgi:hypothetical protein